MKAQYCPNYTNCKLVTGSSIVTDQKTKETYLEDYCRKNEKNWSQCKRYLTKIKLNFCPDFVLPDTNLTPDEIINKFDDELF
jgi:hypothetical protein